MSHSIRRIGLTLFAVGIVAASLGIFGSSFSVCGSSACTAASFLSDFSISQTTPTLVQATQNTGFLLLITGAAAVAIVELVKPRGKLRKK